MIDPITRLKNRVALQRELEPPLLSTLIILEINDFERIGVLYGIANAMSIIRDFGSLLEGFSEKRFDVYRIGDSSFALLAKEEFFDIDELEEIVPELFKAIADNPVYIKEVEDIIDIEVVSGIALGDGDLFAQASMALYHAKSEKKQFLVYTPVMDMSQENRKVLQTKKEIKKALSEQAFVPVYQPIVDRERRVIKYECLMRMRKDEAGEEQLVTPFYFLKVASETKQYSLISESVITQSILFFKERPFDFSINLTYIDMQNRAFMQRLKRLVQINGVGERMIIEIVESESFENYVLLREHLDDLRMLGVRIAIDDFGTGYSNFTHILEVQPDYLKIDGSLIKDMAEDQKIRILVEAIIQFAKRLQITLIAEFVHSETLFKLLHELGIDEFQGFYFAEPLPEVMEGYDVDAEQ